MRKTISSVVSALILVMGVEVYAQTPAGVAVFSKGENGVHTYRIPAVVRCRSGVLLAFAEARRGSTSDTGNIDLVLKRSLDGGATWGEMTTVWDDGDNTCGNPAPVVDRNTGRVILVATWNDGRDRERDIHARTSIDTRRVFCMYSDDEGLTWSEPEEITSQAKLPEWTWYATGPGHAMQLSSGRIVVPCDHGNFGRESTSHVIYSDDGGKAWHIGGDPGVGNESTAAELPGGVLMLNMRKTGPEKEQYGPGRLVALSHDGGLTFGEPYCEQALVEPVCEGSLIGWSGRGKPSSKLIFSNPESPSERVNMTLRISLDAGKTWRRAATLNEGPSAYSDLVVMRKGDVGVLYEGGEKGKYDNIFFARVAKKTLKKALK